jgi:hypothetical protein
VEKSWKLANKSSWKKVENLPISPCARKKKEICKKVVAQEKRKKRKKNKEKKKFNISKKEYVPLI